jgi:NADPH-dependent curcumin reductase CurA
MQGLQIFDYVEEWPAAREELAKLVAQKKVKGHTTLVTGGLQNVEQAWMGQFGGKNTGRY